jgi:PAS domain S-box-containing protein
MNRQPEKIGMAEEKICSMDLNISDIADARMPVVLHELNAYRNAVDAAAIVSITDRKGKIIYVNDLFCEISKYDREELLGKNHRIINSGAHPAEFFREMWQTISDGKVWHGEIKNRAKDGSYYWVDTTISPIFNNAGNVVQYLSIRTLITARKTLEQEREKLITDLTLKYNDTMQFNYIVSHNLKSPVSKIISLATMLDDESEKCDEHVRQLIGYLADSVKSINEVIDDLSSILSVNRDENQKLENVSLLDVIKSVQSSLEKQITETGAYIQTYVDDDVRYLRSNKSFLNSIFFNLIGNAVKYSKKDIHPSIFIKAKRNGRHVVISIKDYGLGIDLNKAGTDIFGLYKRFTTSREGRGLGLYMTKTQVESLGGKIEVASQPGVGSTFTITLPIEENS